MLSGVSQLPSFHLERQRPFRHHFVEEHSLLVLLSATEPRLEPLQFLDLRGLDLHQSGHSLEKLEHPEKIGGNDVLFLLGPLVQH